MTGVSTQRILLVDDEEHLLVTLGDYLSFEGFDVNTASSAEDALKRVETAAPDLIVLDISMPGMGGAAFVKALASRPPPRIPVLVFSAVSDMEKCFGKLQVDGYLAKPCSEVELVRRLRGILASYSRKDNEAARMCFVLLIDPQTDRAEGLRDVLREAGYCAEFVAGGSAALEFSVLKRPDLIVMNHDLGDMESNALLTLLHGMPTTRQIPCLIYGGADQPAPTLAASADVGEARTLQAGDVRDVVRLVGEMLPL